MFIFFEVFSVLIAHQRMVLLFKLLSVRAYYYLWSYGYDALFWSSVWYFEVDDGETYVSLIFVGSFVFLFLAGYPCGITSI